MRVVGVHPVRDPVACGPGPVRFGSAPDNDIVPVGAGIDPHHVSVVADERGLVLDVQPGCQRVYVNARAVRERALLRYGDTLTLGANKFLVATDEEPPAAAARAEGGNEIGPVTLRIMSGTASGQALAVAPELRLGAGTRLFGDLAYACTVAQIDGGLVFESGHAAPRVNGWRCSRARLAPGDQIVLGEHRVVVEAPALQFAAHAASLPPPAMPDPPPERVDAPHNEIWWLIAAAAVLAVLIAFFLYFRW